MPPRQALGSEENQVVTFIPHEGQKRVLNSQSRFIFAMGGNRGGKTTIGCYWAYLQMQKENTNGLIGANVYDQLNQSVLTKFFETFPQLERYYIKRDKMMILPGNRKVFFRSMDETKNIKGMNLHWIWIDEADGLSEEDWFVLQSRTGTTLGKMLMTSSIYPDSWIYDTIYKDENKDYELITWESVDNPSFPREEWDRLKRSMDPVRFAREYESKFIFESGRVYADILKYGVIDKYPEGSEPIVYFFGIDFGIEDPTAIMVLSYNTDGCWYIIDEYYRDHMSVQEINHWLDYFIGKYKRPLITAIDSAGGVARLSLDARANAMDAVKKIGPRLFLLRDLIFQQRLYVFSRCSNAVREFTYYSFNRLKIDEPEDKNNHAMDAIGYVIHTCENMVSGMVEQATKKEEDLTPFWAMKKEQGIYKGEGKLQDRDVNSFDNFLAGGDEW